MFRKQSDFEKIEHVSIGGSSGTSGSPFVSCGRIVFCPTTGTFVVWPEADGQLIGFFPSAARAYPCRPLPRIASDRWATGYLYQGRFKSFPVQSDDHLLGLLRYVERNPLSRRDCLSEHNCGCGAACGRDHQVRRR